jgi:hypothetical protein
MQLHKHLCFTIQYPLAGRLKEAGGKVLVVDCNEEGVMFNEADAAVTFEQFGEIKPPFPCFQELLYDAAVPEGVLNTPILLIQVDTSPTPTVSKKPNSEIEAQDLGKRQRKKPIWTQDYVR